MPVDSLRNGTPTRGGARRVRRAAVDVRILGQCDEDPQSSIRV